MPKTILSVSHDQILLETRGAILRKSGHRVVSVADVAEFASILREREIDLVILGHTLDSGDRDEAYRILQELDAPPPVIELYATLMPPKTPAQFQLAVHDRTFPIDLLNLVQQVLSSSQA